ncbi:MAG: iron-containing alcohol dehydrogenase [Bacteroidales bacterium]|nr:iron-containing alcohol dehydrogenase [Bacteroidales bacterium]
MKDFTFHTPTEVAFGKESEARIPSLIRKYGGNKVLIHYGGGSAVKSGLVDEIKRYLSESGIEYVELGGVVPNPLLSKVQEGIELCKSEDVDFILAVGGGSVIDSSKAIGYGVCYDGDVWDFYDGKASPKASLPVGAVLTIAAAGSEMSDSSVITKDEGHLKRGCNSDVCRCRFAVMNPERTKTLPAWQTAAGITDIMMHTLERYFSHETMTLTDSVAEALLRTTMECGEKLMAHPEDYDLRAQIMWASSLSHNGLTGCGAVADFATHKIGHELSALFGSTHGATLSVIWPAWAEYVLAEDPGRFAQFATNVLGITPQATDVDTARAGIASMRSFFTRIGMPTTISSLIGRPATSDEIATMASKCTIDGSFTPGNFKKLTRQDVINIYNAAN